MSPEEISTEEQSLLFDMAQQRCIRCVVEHRRATGIDTQPDEWLGPVWEEMHSCFLTFDERGTLIGYVASVLCLRSRSISFRFQYGEPSRKLRIGTGPLLIDIPIIQEQIIDDELAHRILKYLPEEARLAWVHGVPYRQIAYATRITRCKKELNAAHANPHK